MNKYIKIIALIMISIGSAFAENNYTCNDLQLPINNDTSYVLHIYYSKNDKNVIYTHHLVIPPHQPAKIVTVRYDQGFVFTDMQIYLAKTMPKDSLEMTEQSPLLNSILSIEKSYGRMLTGYANCLRGVQSYWPGYYYCAHDPNVSYVSNLISDMAQGSRLIQQTKFPNIEVEVELLNIGYCSSDISKEKSGVVKVTMREKPALTI